MMGFPIGRARLLAAFAFGTTALSSGSPRAAAQDGEEVILDPELAGPSAPATSEPAPAEPAEDFGWGPVDDANARARATPPPLPSVAAASSREEDDYDPLANTGLARLEMLGQVAADIHQEGDLEDAYESRFRFGGEVELRRSRRLRLMLGSRIDFFWAVPGQNDNVVRASGERALDEDRFEVDVFATAAYVDTTLGDGLHLRLGQQVVSLARMDFFSPTDILTVYDLRPQPRLDLAANKLAQPAVRLDWDLNSWATIQAVYVPWFMPHLSRPNRDQYVGKVTGGTGTGQAPANLRELVDPSNQTKLSESMLRFVAPPPDFKTPQAEIRANFRGDSMELALSAGTAIEKLPSVYFTPAVNDYSLNPNNAEAEGNVAGGIYGQQTLVDVDYHRYYMLGLDGSFDVAPFSIGFEFSFNPSRHLYAATNDGKHLPLPNTTEQIVDPGKPVGDGPWTPSNVANSGIRKGVPVVQGAIHAEWLKGETFALVSEIFWLNALALPHDKSRDWWGFIPNTGAYVGGMLAASYMINDGKVRFDVTTITLVGPSLILIPHVEVKARDNLFLDAGAQIFEGPDPGVNGMQKLNVGGLLSGYDQVFLGIRWLP
jgi:hypothetical protein